MNVITDLPAVTGTDGSTKNGLLVCIDKLSKFTRLIPVFVGEGDLTARQVALLFFDGVVKLFGVP